MTLTGMALVEAIRDGSVTPPSGISTMGLDRTHQWITGLEPGRVTMEWEVDPAYLNLEGAVMCTWLAAMADQAVFFASNAACREGEGTRMASFHLDVARNIGGGSLRLEAEVLNRMGDRMTARCELFDAAGQLAAVFNATLDVIEVG